jgi:hypothetical protein
MHALEYLAMRHNLSTPRTHTPVLYKLFSDTVYKLGLIPRFGCMSRFYLSVNPFGAVKAIPVGLDLLRHGRLQFKAMTLKPQAKRQLQAILDKARAFGGVS